MPTDVLLFFLVVIIPEIFVVTIPGEPLTTFTALVLFSTAVSPAGRPTNIPTYTAKKARKEHVKA